MVRKYAEILTQTCLELMYKRQNSNFSFLRQFAFFNGGYLRALKHMQCNKSKFSFLLFFNSTISSSLLYSSVNYESYNKFVKIALDGHEAVAVSLAEETPGILCVNHVI